MADSIMRFLHVGFDRLLTSEVQSSLNEVFNEATDWLRYSPNAWVLYTSQSPKIWAEKIRVVSGLPQNTGFVIVPMVAEEKWGYHTKTIWDWFEKPR